MVWTSYVSLDVRLSFSFAFVNSSSGIAHCLGSQMERDSSPSQKGTFIFFCILHRICCKVQVVLSSLKRLPLSWRFFCHLLYGSRNPSLQVYVIIVLTKIRSEFVIVPMILLLGGHRGASKLKRLHLLDKNFTKLCEEKYGNKKRYEKSEQILQQ